MNWSRLWPAASLLLLLQACLHEWEVLRNEPKRVGDGSMGNGGLGDGALGPDGQAAAGATVSGGSNGIPPEMTDADAGSRGTSVHAGGSAGAGASAGAGDAAGTGGAAGSENPPDGAGAGGGGVEACSTPRLAPVTLETANGTTRFVTPSGTDGDGHGTEQSPFKTIAYALGHLAGAKVVLVRPGTYAECLVLGLDQEGVTLEGDRSGEVVLDGSACEHVVRVRTNVTRATVIRGFVIQNGVATGGTDEGGGVYLERAASPVIEGNTIRNNSAWSGGGGVFIGQDSTALVRHNLIETNSVEYDGAGIQIYQSSPVVEFNSIHLNSAGRNGGGIDCESRCLATIRSNIIYRNDAGSSSGADGAGIAVYESSPIITNNLIVENVATAYFQGGNDGGLGGGIFVGGFNDVAEPVISNNTLVANQADFGGAFAFGAGAYDGSTPLIQRNVVVTNAYGETHSGGEAFYFGADAKMTPHLVANVLWENEGGAYGGFVGNAQIESSNLQADPKFVCGPLDGYYLSSLSAGEDSNSPGLDAGLVEASTLGLAATSTTSDGAPDTGLVDLGYHR